MLAFGRSRQEDQEHLAGPGEMAEQDIYCFFRKPLAWLPAPMVTSRQPPLTPVPGDLLPTSDLLQHLHACTQALVSYALLRVEKGGLIH